MPYKDKEAALAAGRKSYAKNKEKHAAWMKEWYKRNRDSVLAQQAEYYRENREEILEKQRARDVESPEKRRAASKAYRSTEAAKEKERAAKKRRMQIPSVLLAIKLRQRLNKAVAGKYKTGSAVSDLGCSIDDFVKYIEERFSPGMTWGNYGEWHLDHIIPLVSFDLEDRSQFLAACHYSNIQPLWASENLSKGARHEGNPLGRRPSPRTETPAREHPGKSGLPCPDYGEM